MWPRRIILVCSILAPSPVITDPCSPSPCGDYAECRVRDGAAACSCKLGYLGRPPYCRPECVANSECLTSLACVNQKCVDPCVGVCGVNAECHVIQHNPICKCPNLFRGDPNSICTPIPASKLEKYSTSFIRILTFHNEAIFRLFKPEYVNISKRSRYSYD